MAKSTQPHKPARDERAYRNRLLPPAGGTPRVEAEEPSPAQRDLERAALRYADDFARGEGDFDLLRREIRAILEGKSDP